MKSIKGRSLSKIVFSDVKSKLVELNKPKIEPERDPSPDDRIDEGM